MPDIHNMNYVINEINAHFGYLFHDGIQIHKVFDRLAFGNWIVVLNSEKCVIRIIQDRRQISLEAAPSWASVDIKDSEHFTDLNLLVAYLENKEKFSSVDKVSSSEDQFKNLGLLLKSHYEEIISFLTSDEYFKREEEIALYHQKQIKKIFPNARFRHR